MLYIYIHIYSVLEWWLPTYSVWCFVKHLPAMQETRVRTLGWEVPLEKEMATHSSILAWRIPWIEEPGRLSISWDRKSQTRLSTIFLSFPKVKSRFVQFPVGLPTLFMWPPWAVVVEGGWPSLLPWTIIYTTNIRVRESSNCWRCEQQISWYNRYLKSRQKWN